MTKNFDRVAAAYDQTRGYPPGVAEAVMSYIARALDLAPERSRLLELGVGSGRIALPFIHAGYHYTGVDISQNMLSLLREKLGNEANHATLLMADVAALPLPERSMHCVLAVHILHLVDTARGLAEVKRVLAPGGALVWGWDHHDPASPLEQLRRQYSRYVRQHVPTPQAWMAANGVIRNWAIANGCPDPEPTAAVRWERSATARQTLEALAQRLWSGTWETPDHVHDGAVAAARAWAQMELGDLDAQLTAPCEFRVALIRPNP